MRRLPTAGWCACWRIGARHFRDTTSITRAGGSRRRRSGCWWRRCDFAGEAMALRDVRLNGEVKLARIRTDSVATCLKGGDRRSIGRADEIASLILREHGRLGELWDCLQNTDPLARMCAADALEKISRVLPNAAVLTAKLEDGSAEVRWHLIAITSRLALQASEAARFYAYLDQCLHRDTSRIVKVAALQAAYDLAVKFPQLSAEFNAMRVFARSSPWPSVIARAARLIPKEVGRLDT